MLSTAKLTGNCDLDKMPFLYRSAGLSPGSASVVDIIITTPTAQTHRSVKVAYIAAHELRHPSPWQ